MSQLLKFALSLIIILAVVGAFVVILRRVTGGKLISSEADRSRNRQPRLGVVDIYDLDRSRQLVLLRRDNVEHLVLIGGPNDVVVESNIVRVSNSRVHSPADNAFERQETADIAQAKLIPEQPVRPVVDSFFKNNQSEPFGEQPSYIEPRVAEPEAYQPAQQQDEQASLASQATVAAASIAAVAAATQYGHELAETVEESVPDFLKGSSSTDNSYEPVEPPAQEAAYQSYTAPVEAAEPIVEAAEPAVEAAAPVQTNGNRFNTAYLSNPYLSTPAAPVADAPLSSLHVQEELQPEMTEPAEETLPEESDAIAFEEVAVAPDHPIEEPAPKAHIEEILTENVVLEEPEASITETVEEETQESTPEVQIDEALFSDMARQLEEALKTSTAPSEAEEITQPVEVAEEEVSAISEEVTADAVTEVETAEDQETVASAEQEESKEETVSKTEKEADPFSLDDIEAEFARLLGRSDKKSDNS
ncbi:hypothetical protein WJT86_10345 [Microvirga sp. W0021]|uniref:Flagellar biosynthesis protein FliO n=1 Tax=Hohaiivirga grylli TaxID=3133970 RepID=A0ABV0BL02_9HYPH